MGGVKKVLCDELTNASAIQPEAQELIMDLKILPRRNIKRGLLELEFKIQGLRLFQDKEKITFYLVIP